MDLTINEPAKVQTYGKVVNTDGVYEGEFKDDRRHGKGTMTYVNGSKYEGSWQAGKKYGQGTLMEADGTIRRGFWRKGRLDGSGSVCAHLIGL
mmetsp:Transcript_65407/g.175478  ORF Transcript_65407/g.175478 Transcript_65407/m.175478 type:complete len:93 (+) Transcript_65407:779-1057(+)